MTVSFAESTLSRVLNKLNQTGGETTKLCRDVDEVQQRNILKEWFTQAIVYMVAEMPDYPQ
jgi:hypothetical protein